MDRRREALAVFVLALFAVLLLEVGRLWYARDSVGRMVDDHHTSQLTQRFTSYPRAAGIPSRTFHSRIEFDPGRKGKFAWLTLHELSGPDVPAPERWDIATTPVAIQLRQGLEAEFASRPQPLSHRFGPGVFGLRVAEPEMGYAPAWLYAFHLNDDLVPEFFLHQHADVNERAMPIPAGTWLLQFDEVAGTWELRRWWGIRPFFMAGARVRQAQCIILLITALVTLWMIDGKAPKRSSILWNGAAGLGLWYLLGLDCALFVLLFSVGTGVLGWWILRSVSGVTTLQED